MTRAMLVVIEETREWAQKILSLIPGRVGNVLRCAWYRQFNDACEFHYIGEGCKIVSPHFIKTGKNVGLSEGCYLNANGGLIEIGSGSLFNQDVHINASCGGAIRIGEDCLIGPAVVMRTASHRFGDPDVLIRNQGHTIGDIVLGRDCWVGAQVVILGGVTIGDGAVIGAGALVNRNIPSMSIAVGVPAKVVKQRVKGGSQ